MNEKKQKTKTTEKRDSDRKVYQTGLQVRHFRVEGKDRHLCQGNDIFIS